MIGSTCKYSAYNNFIRHCLRHYYYFYRLIFCKNWTLSIRFSLLFLISYCLSRCKQCSSYSFWNFPMCKIIKLIIIGNEKLSHGHIFWYWTRSRRNYISILFWEVDWNIKVRNRLLCCWWLDDLCWNSRVHFWSRCGEQTSRIDFIVWLILL